jgi:hypothetical protein
VGEALSIESPKLATQRPAEVLFGTVLNGDAAEERVNDAPPLQQVLETSIGGAVGGHRRIVGSGQGLGLKVAGPVELRIPYESLFRATLYGLASPPALEVLIDSLSIFDMGQGRYT